MPQSTVNPVLRILLSKKLIKVSDIVHSGKVLARSYEPLPAAKEAVLKYIKDTYFAVSAVVTVDELYEALKMEG